MEEELIKFKYFLVLKIPLDSLFIEGARVLFAMQLTTLQSISRQSGIC